MMIEIKNQHQLQAGPIFLPPKMWVGIADLGTVRMLTEPLGVNAPADEIRRQEDVLYGIARKAFSDRVALVGEQSLAAGMDGLVRRAQQRFENPIVISCDPHLVTGAEGIDTTRIISMKKINPEILGEGSRPGSVPLPRQIEKIRDQHPDQDKVIFVDDVLFDGGTTRKIIEEIERIGLAVAEVVVGVSKKREVGYLRNKGIAFSPLIVAPEPIDINNLRDFVGSAPLGGRVYGYSEGTTPVPYVDRNGISFATPYTLPNGHPESWATIPHQYVAELSQAGWQASIDLYKMIGNALGRDVTLGDLTKSNARTSYPGPKPKHIDGDALNPDMPVVAIFQHKQHKAALLSTHANYSGVSLNQRV